MKQKLIATLLTATLLSATAAFATTTPAPAAPASARLTYPKPVHVVEPTGLPARFKNTVVKVSLTIDRNGMPHNVAPVGNMPEEVAKRLLPAVAQWQFSPLYENGRAVNADVILPLELVEGV